MVDVLIGRMISFGTTAFYLGIYSLCFDCVFCSYRSFLSFGLVLLSINFVTVLVFSHRKKIVLLLDHVLFASKNKRSVFAIQCMLIFRIIYHICILVSLTFL